MNYIKQLQLEIKQLKANIECAKTEVAAFNAHLNGPKFYGTDKACAVCGRMQQGIEIQCTSLIAGKLCGGVVTEERKDWIATADVIQRLQHIYQWLG